MTISQFLQLVQCKAANGGTQVEQETEAFNIAYTIGGLTLGFQDAKTADKLFSWYR